MNIFGGDEKGLLKKNLAIFIARFFIVYKVYNSFPLEKSFPME